MKKFRQREIGWPGDARGRNKLTPPKQALVSPWPAWYLIPWSRSENQLVFIKILPSCRRRLTEVRKVLRGHLSPAGFWRRQFAPPPGNERGFSLLPSEFFHSFPPRGGGLTWGGNRTNRAAPQSFLPLRPGLDSLLRKTNDDGHHSRRRKPRP